MTTLITRSVLDRELSMLQANIVRLGSMVEVAIEQAMLALENRSHYLATQVIDGDLEINALRFQIEEDVMRIIATQQPAASDLRTVLAASHIAGELERMGDHAVGIARLAERIDGADEITSLHQLPKMAKRARKMVRSALDAYIGQDPVLAESLMPRDLKIDKGYSQLFDQATEEMRDNAYIERATFLLWIGHGLERIGDRAVNIAERVVFMCTGRMPESN